MQKAVIEQTLYIKLSWCNSDFRLQLLIQWLFICPNNALAGAIAMLSSIIQKQNLFIFHRINMKVFLMKWAFNSANKYFT